MQISAALDGTISYGGEGGKPEPAKVKPADKPASDKTGEPGAPTDPAPKA